MSDTCPLETIITTCDPKITEACTFKEKSFSLDTLKKLVDTFPGLKKLSFVNCDLPKALDALTELKKLEFLHLDLTKDQLAQMDVILPTLKRLTHLGLRCRGLQNGDIAFLEKMPKLKSLDLSESDVTYKCVDTLCHLTRLEYLNLSNCSSFSGKGFVRLSNLKKLKSLKLKATATQDADLEHLKNFSSLKALDLRFCLSFDKEGIHSLITNEGVKYLSSLKGLHRLLISGNGLSNEAVKSLSKLKHLEELDISGNRIDDNGLLHAKGFSKLKTLALYCTDVTEQGLAYLSEMKDLQVQVA